jgi:hypothetical protein
LRTPQGAKAGQGVVRIQPENPRIEKYSWNQSVLKTEILSYSASCKTAIPIGIFFIVQPSPPLHFQLGKLPAPHHILCAAAPPRRKSKCWEGTLRGFFRADTKACPKISFTGICMLLIVNNHTVHCEQHQRREKYNTYISIY